MTENIFNEDYFTSYLQTVCSSEGNDGKISLSKVSNITIGHVLSAHSLGTFSDQHILKWIHKGRKLTPLIEKQFLLYKRLAKYLINYVKPEDVDAWKEILTNRKYVWPTEKREGWASVFGEVPDLCNKISLAQTTGKTSCDQDSKDDDSLSNSKHDCEENLESEYIVELDYDEDFDMKDDEEINNSVMLDLRKNIDVKKVEEGYSSDDLVNMEIFNRNDNKAKTIEKHDSVDAVTTEIQNFNSGVSKKEESVVKNENGDPENIEKVGNDESETEGFEEDFFTNDFFSDDEDGDESTEENDKDSKDEYLIETKIGNEDFKACNEKLDCDKILSSEDEDFKASNKELDCDKILSSENEDFKACNEELDYDEILSEDEKDKDSDILQLYAEDDFHEEIKLNEERGNEFESHIKCITEDQKNVGTNYIEKEVKGERKHFAWINNIQTAIANAKDMNPQVKSLLKKILGFENIPRKREKFENYLANSVNVKDPIIINQVWEVFDAANKGGIENQRQENKNNDKPKFIHKPLEEKLSFASKDIQSNRERVTSLSTEIFRKKIWYKKIYLVGDNASQITERLLLPNVFALDVRNHIAVKNKIDERLMKILREKPKDTLFILLNNYECFNHEIFATFDCKSEISTLQPAYNVYYIRISDKSKWQVQSYLNMAKDYLQTVQNQLAPELCSTVVFAPLHPKVYFMSPNKSNQKEMKAFDQTFLELQDGGNGINLPLLIPSDVTPLQKAETFCFMGEFPKYWRKFVTEILQKNNISASLLDKYPNCSQYQFTSFDNRADTMKTDKRLCSMWDSLLKLFIQQILHAENISKGESTSGVSTPRLPFSSLPFTRTIPPAGVLYTGAPMPRVLAPGIPPKSLPPTIASMANVSAPVVQPSYYKSDFYNNTPTGYSAQAIGIPQGQFQNSWQSGVSYLNQEPSAFVNSAHPPAVGSLHNPYTNIAVQPSAISQPAIHAPPSYFQPPPSHSNVGIPTSASSQSLVVSSQFSQPPPSLPNTAAAPPLPLSQNKNTGPTNSASSVPQVPKGINIAILRNIPKVLKNDEVEKILNGCGKIYKYERRPLSSDMCSVHYHDGESTLRCRRLLHCRTLLNTKLRVNLPYEDSFTEQELVYINQGMENVATFVLNQNIKKIEEEYKKISVEIKESNDKVAKVKHEIYKKTESFDKNQNEKEGIKGTQRSKSKSLEIEVIKLGRSSKNKGKSSGIRKTDESDSSGSRSRSRSPSRSSSRRHRRSKSRSPKTRYRKSRSKSSDRRHRRNGRRSLDRRPRKSRSKSSEIMHRKKGSKSTNEISDRSEHRDSDRRSRSRRRDRIHRKSSSSSSDSISSSRSNMKSRSTSPDIKLKRSRSRSTEIEYKKVKSRISDILEKDPSKHNIKVNDPYIAPVTQKSSLNLQEDTDQFSVLGACQLLMGFCDKIGYLGHSLRAAMENVKKCGNSSSKITKSLIDSEGQELLGLIVGKLKNLREGTQDSILQSKYNQALIATNFLLKHIEFYLDIAKLDIDRSKNTRNEITERNVENFGSNISNNSSSSFNSNMNDVYRNHKQVHSINYENNIASGSSHNTGSDQLTSEEVLLLQKLLGKKKEHILSSSLYTGLQNSLTNQNNHTYIPESHTQRGLQMERPSSSTFNTPPAISNMLEEIGENMGLNTNFKYDHHSRNQRF